MEEYAATRAQAWGAEFLIRNITPYLQNVESILFLSR